VPSGHGYTFLMADKDEALAILQAAIAIAGLVLVYSGFVLARGAALSDVRKQKKFQRLAKLGLVPVTVSLICSLMGVRVLLPGRCGSAWSSNWILFTFEVVLFLTGAYSIIAAFYGS
jgi:hypothetical protein